MIISYISIRSFFVISSPIILQIAKSKSKHSPVAFVHIQHVVRANYLASDMDGDGFLFSKKFSCLEYDSIL